MHVEMQRDAKSDLELPDFLLVEEARNIDDVRHAYFAFTDNALGFPAALDSEREKGGVNEASTVVIWLQPNSRCERAR
jgi:hypothetical protein